MSPEREQMIEWLTAVWLWAGDNRFNVWYALSKTERETPIESELAALMQIADDTETDLWQAAEDMGLTGNGLLAEALLKELGPAPFKKEVPW